MAHDSCNVIEYRIVLPFTLNEYNLAQLFTTAEFSKTHTANGEGVQILKDQPYQDGNIVGQYTEKFYFLESRCPSFIKSIAPKNSLKLKEECWYSYPSFRTILTNLYMKNKFEVCLDTLVVADNGTSENVFNLPAEQRKSTKVVNIDIANDNLPLSDYDERFDPALVEFDIDGRGALSKNWIAEAKRNDLPLVCCYKLVKCRFDYWGLKSTAERLFHNQQKKLLIMFHRQMYCMMDTWYNKSLDEIRKIENETTLELESLRNQVKTNKINFD